MAEAKAWVIVPKLDSDKTGCVLQVFPLVQCKDCIHRGWYDEKRKNYEYPDERCPAQCADFFYGWRPGDDWFCANGEVKQDG